MLDRVGKAVIMSAETETAEIIRRRLFEWDSPAVTQDGRIILSPRKRGRRARPTPIGCMSTASSCPAGSRSTRRRGVPGNLPVPPDGTVGVRAQVAGASPLPTHARRAAPAGAVGHAAYQSGYRGAHKDPLMGIGTAPLEDPMFRSAVFEQLGEGRAGGRGHHRHLRPPRVRLAVRLDDEAVETIRRGRLHRQVATAIFFESNGGQQPRDGHRAGDSPGRGRAGSRHRQRRTGAGRTALVVLLPDRGRQQLSLQRYAEPQQAAGGPPRQHR